jgi:hypothetical protein
MIWPAATAMTADRASHHWITERKGTEMVYVVEVGVAAGNLAGELTQMRTWLDHMKFHAIGFRKIPGKDVCRVDFQGDQEARAFAQAFAGRVLNRAAATAVL